MTTITKYVDIRMDDYEVEIELDTDDLENFDSDDLWEALNNSASNSDIARLVTGDSDVLQAVLEGVEQETLLDLVDVDEALAERIGSMTTDERKEVVRKWIDEETPMAQPLCQFIRETISDVPAPATRDLVADVRAAVQSPNGVSAYDIIKALVEVFGGGAVVGYAVSAIERGCKGSQP